MSNAPQDVPATTVLIVEDEAVIAHSLAEVLGESGFRVLGIADSEERTRSLIKDERPDIALVDIRIRNEDGEEIGTSGIRLAEELWICDRVPVVFVTAFPDLVNREVARNSGAFGVVAKPYSTPTLLAQIELTLAKAGDSH